MSETAGQHSGAHSGDTADLGDRTAERTEDTRSTPAAAPVCELAPSDPEAALRPDPDPAGPRADCVLCGEPTELPADHPGSTLCPVCAWQQAQRIACSG
ncbi:hypothetical protein ACIQ9P_18405 [Kitasatospora sp. NPDC094019]|uniref:hypothetical protein n=1 Tax=Kitasatospora sp. NPDC094019 TaxID=3364091 RepID=UPI00382A470D